MTENTNYERIKKIIAQLLAKAKSTDNEHEAAAFIAKAEDMLEQYQIDLSELGDESDKVRHHAGLDADGKWIASWHRNVYRHLGQYYGCKSIKVHTANGYRQELVGRESAIVTTDLMFVFIKGERNRLGRQMKLDGGAPTDANEVLAQLRPIWPQGYTTDSQAAQALGNAVSEMWELLYATDQTQALENLRSLIETAATLKQELALDRDPRHGNY